MINIEELFTNSEDGKLTYEQFEKLIKDKGVKLADLSEGKYVSKSKYDSDIKAKDTDIEGLNSQIEQLNSTISTRDTDLADLQKQLEAAGTDSAKLAELTTQFTGLQNKYEADIKDYQQKMQHQSYEFAVKEFASKQNFSSEAARRDFTKSMIDRNLEMENGKILGREDFLEAYANENVDAFITESAEPEPQPDTVVYEPEPEPIEPDIPTFVSSTPGPSISDDSDFDFNFLGVREH